MQRNETSTNGLASEAAAVAQDLRLLLADVFALHMKTKNFHWHMTGPHFHDYHLLLDEQAGELFAITDEIAERARKLGFTTIRSIAEIGRHQRLKDSDRENLPATDMLEELRSDNLQLVGFLRTTHEVCDRSRDVATAGLIETWIDQAERRVWFLSQTLSDDLAGKVNGER
jgi:starvation-inducible DNA-binding protein